MPAGGGRATYVYDGDGRRVQQARRRGIGARRLGRLEHRPGTGRDGIVSVAQDIDYVLEPQQYGNLLAFKGPVVTAARYYHYDGLGSADRLTNASRTVTDSYAYSGYGEPQLAAGPTTNPFQFVGRLGYYADNVTKLTYLRAP